MKKFLLFAALMMLAVPALSQDIGVYFDPEGMNPNLSYEAYAPGYGPFSTIDAYVIGYAEALIGGGAFKLEVTPNILPINPVYPDGINAGNLVDGVEIAITEAVVAYYHQPVVLCSMEILFLSVGNLDEIQVLPHPSYETVVLAEASGALIPATGFTSALTPLVDNDQESWGQVKSLFQ